MFSLVSRVLAAEIVDLFYDSQALPTEWAPQQTQRTCVSVFVTTLLTRNRVLDVLSPSSSRIVTVARFYFFERSCCVGKPDPLTSRFKRGCGRATRSSRPIDWLRNYRKRETPKANAW